MEKKSTQYASRSFAEPCKEAALQFGLTVICGSGQGVTRQHRYGHLTSITPVAPDAQITLIALDECQ